MDINRKIAARQIRVMMADMEKYRLSHKLRNNGESVSILLLRDFVSSRFGPFQGCWINDRYFCDTIQNILDTNAFFIKDHNNYYREADDMRAIVEDQKSLGVKEPDRRTLDRHFHMEQVKAFLSMSFQEEAKFIAELYLNGQSLARGLGNSVLVRDGYGMDAKPRYRISIEGKIDV